MTKAAPRAATAQRFETSRRRDAQPAPLRFGVIGTGVATARNLVGKSAPIRRTAGIWTDKAAACSARCPTVSCVALSHPARESHKMEGRDLSRVKSYLNWNGDGAARWASIPASVIPSERSESRDLHPCAGDFARRLLRALVAGTARRVRLLEKRSVT